MGCNFYYFFFNSTWRSWLTTSFTPSAQKIKYDSVRDGRLRPGAATLQSQPNNVFWRPADAAIWRTEPDIRVVFDSAYIPSIVFKENMTSSRKLEIHNLSNYRQRRTEPQPPVPFREICTRGFWITRVDRQTNKQTYRHSDRNDSYSTWRRSNNTFLMSVGTAEYVSTEAHLCIV